MCSAGMEDLVLLPSGRRSRHALPPSIIAKNVARTGRDPTDMCRGVTMEAGRLDDSGGRHTTHAEDIAELADADSIAVGGILVEEPPSRKRWCSRRSVTAIRDAITKRRNSGDDAEKKSGAFATPSSPQQREPTQKRKSVVFSAFVFGERTVRPEKNDVEEAPENKRKASRALSDAIAEKVQLVTDRLLRRDSALANLSGRRRKGSGVNRAASEDREFLLGSAEAARNASSSTFASARSTTTPCRGSNVPEVEDGEEMSSSARARALEDLHPLVAHRAHAEEVAAAIPGLVTQLANHAVTPEDLPTRADDVHAMKRLFEGVCQKVNEGSMDNWRVEQHFDDIHRGIISDRAYRRDVMHEYVEGVGAEQRQAARNHQRLMREWRDSGRPVSHSWRQGRGNGTTLDGRLL